MGGLLYAFSLKHNRPNNQFREQRKNQFVSRRCTCEFILEDIPADEEAFFCDERCSKRIQYNSILTGNNFVQNTKEF